MSPAMARTGASRSAGPKAAGTGRFQADRCVRPAFVSRTPGPDSDRARCCASGPGKASLRSPRTRAGRPRRCREAPYGGLFAVLVLLVVVRGVALTAAAAAGWRATRVPPARPPSPGPRARSRPPSPWNCSYRPCWSSRSDSSPGPTRRHGGVRWPSATAVCPLLTGTHGSAARGGPRQPGGAHVPGHSAGVAGWRSAAGPDRRIGAGPVVREASGEPARPPDDGGRAWFTGSDGRRASAHLDRDVVHDERGLQ